ncbi:MAG: PTS sugar transporter subunit IIC [Vagococcus fluvialis]|jgi:PTS system cellobiose-specific IIC component|uniref:Permease IIC component n=1 Tax=Vagococcus fluvialis TaxID=2738 RepID=A0A7X6DA85_9ENTE|nr:PTS sugar transporter subunit IIC [Vagococcus fluvialis]MDR2278826.1 PTS sugar transporter subunit IIC [Vagococcus sp.]OTP29166.1 PTS system, cellobiose-specific IIC component [Enterococcus sp. 6C8_DIV0013]MBO0419757.1 PTS sugar transporter subunit IIC [Vagococcus fluvialis]MBO0427951.1 PTS sugar transporter subunit IIC [Vagococcus fluvialis]MBO0437403.1 PTS sugar transporter subunit IIC [Vagococcus fluvialis]
MNGFVEFMEAKFIPVASKIGAQRHLVAIRDAFMVTMPLMILGALVVMINNLPIPFFQNFMNSIFGGESWKGFGGSVWNGTFAIISVAIAFLVAYNLANGYKKDGVSAGIVSVASFFALGGATGMASNGLFVALIVAIISTELFVKLTSSDKLVIKMPDGVPPAVGRAFASLLPAMIIISLFGLVAAIFAGFGVPDIITSFYDAVQQPFMGLANTYPAALLIAFITPFLWFFGLHGANMIDPFMQTINVTAIDANAAAVTAGKAAPYIVNKPFIDVFVNLGGTGATFGLIIAIFLVGRKHESFNVVNKLSAAPGLFNINEPMLFGLPIVLNPIMFIPFILTPMVLVTTAYFSTKAGLVPVATSIPPWVTPPIIGGLLATSSFKGAILAAVNLLISVLIYMPFVKISVIQELKKEASN